VLRIRRMTPHPHRLAASASPRIVIFIIPSRTALARARRARRFRPRASDSRARAPDPRARRPGAVRMTPTARARRVARARRYVDASRPPSRHARGR
jgi:hypothetical protein